MNKFVSKTLCFGVLALAAALTTATANAQRVDVHVGVHTVFDGGHGHNRYYLAPGAVVRAVPRGAYMVRYHDRPYYFREGVWYRNNGARFVVAHPPIGVVITALPPFYTTLWFGGVPYYYADYVYYRWEPSARGYTVVAPPDGSAYDGDSDALPPEAAGSTATNNDVFVYPKNGQSEQQQSTDRYECHRWASDQTGFDPTKTQGGVNANEVRGKRGDYRRAESVCLEARGYSVK